MKCDTNDTRKRKSFPDRIGQNGTILEDRKKPKCVAFSALDKVGQNWTCKKPTEREHGYENDV